MTYLERTDATTSLTGRLSDLAVDRDSNARLAAAALLEGDNEGARWYAERFQKFAAEHAAARAELVASMQASGADA